jgi:hypothetical protein
MGGFPNNEESTEPIVTQRESHRDQMISEPYAKSFGQLRTNQTQLTEQAGGKGNGRVQSPAGSIPGEEYSRTDGNENLAVSSKYCRKTSLRKGVSESGRLVTGCDNPSGHFGECVAVKVDNIDHAAITQATYEMGTSLQEDCCLL